MKKLFVLVAKALGVKAHEDDKVADRVAIIRIVLALIYVIGNLAVVANLIRHWND